jgi:hypothetical protein
MGFKYADVGDTGVYIGKFLRTDLSPFHPYCSTTMSSATESPERIECEDCGNTTSFVRLIKLEEPWEQQDDGEWDTDFSAGKVRDQLDFWCAECESRNVERWYALD